MESAKSNFLSSTTVLFLFVALSASSFAAGIDGEKNSDGSFKKWHRIEVVFDGPQAEESSATFRNYRLDVTFTSPSGKQYNVPGFFDADGDPANTSATFGNKWKARFAGGEEGVFGSSSKLNRAGLGCPSENN